MKQIGIHEEFYGTGGVTALGADRAPFSGAVDATGWCEFLSGVAANARISNSGGGICHGDFAGVWISTGHIVVTGRILPGARIDTTGNVYGGSTHPDWRR